MTELDAASSLRDRAEAPAPVLGPPSPVRLRRAWGTAAAWIGAGLACAVLLWHVDRSVDLSDEAFFALASDPPHRGDAFNGVSGLYLRPLWEVAQWNIAVVRVLALLITMGVGVLLGRATARLLSAPSAPIVAAGVAAATGVFAAGWRTPSYNWLAVLGAAVACAAVLRLLADDSPRWGLVAGAGIALATTGKVTTGAALALLVGIVLAVARRSALGWAAGALTAAVALHAVVVLSPAETLRSLARSAAHLAAVDPQHYTVLGTLRVVPVEVGFVLLGAIGFGGLAGLLPLAALGRQAARAWYPWLCAGAVLVAAVMALNLHAWGAGIAGIVYDGGGFAAVLAAVAVLVLVGRRSGLPRRPAARQLWGAVVLTLAALACMLGTNIAWAWQLNIATVLLAPAAILACAALPRPAVRATTAAVVAAACAGSLVVAVQVEQRPRLSPPLADAVTPIQLGRVRVTVDPATAQQLAALRRDADAAGWRPGTPLMDTAFVPGIPMAMQASLPPILLPVIPGLGYASVCTAVRGAGRPWQDAWVLVFDTISDEDLDTVAGALGHARQDYVRVGSFRSPWLHRSLLLLRPAQRTAAGAGCVS